MTDAELERAFADSDPAMLERLERVTEATTRRGRR